MSSFKDKPLKKCHSDKRLTIDVIHNNMITEFASESKETENIKNQIKTESNKKNLLFLNNKLEKIREQEKIKEERYFFDNTGLLNDYYNNDCNIVKKESKKKNNILNYFNEICDNESDNENKRNKEPLSDNIIDLYLSNIDDHYINSNFKDIDDELHICNNCKNKLFFKANNSEMFCKNCGYTETILLSNDKISYKDVPREISYFAYKRINHFNEWLAQFQAKETTEIPKEIYINVLNELKKNINNDINSVSYKQVREILKKLKYNKYYEHIPHIITVIGGNKAPTLLCQYEELLRNMFKEIQIPFMKNCPEERKNFLSYSYVLHKFCQLLELDELLIHFPLLKSREKLQQQDKIWESICNDLKWQYIASV